MPGTRTTSDRCLPARKAGPRTGPTGGHPERRRQTRLSTERPVAVLHVQDDQRAGVDAQGAAEIRPPLNPGPM
jgi:hypothetical protein